MTYEEFKDVKTGDKVKLINGNDPEGRWVKEQEPYKGKIIKVVSTTPNGIYTENNLFFWYSKIEKVIPKVDFGL